MSIGSNLNGALDVPRALLCTECCRTDHSSVAMGSHRMFARFPCHLCSNSSMVNDPDELELCISCQNLRLIEDFTRTSVGRYLFVARGLPIQLVEPLVRYPTRMPDPSAEFRRYYLRILLQGPPMGQSPFRRTTYASNSIAGSISDQEDILDRILAFTV